MTVAILGASNNPEKYSYKALKLLREKGHEVFPVHPALKEIEGLKVYASLADLPKPVHTLTLYVSPEISSKMTSQILASSPRRILFNPGAENTELETRARAQGIQALEACTLVLLHTDQFDKISNP